MKILLFGGAFDPPHIGHISLLQNAVEKVKPDLVMVIPTGRAPHKAASSTAAAQRLAMCNCFKPLFSPLVISDAEIKRTGNSYTWETIQEVQAEYPQAKLYLCIGSDMLHSFTKWHAYEKIVKAVTLVAQDRLDTDIPRSRVAAKQLEAMGGKVLFTRGAVKPVSSSEIRQLFLEKGVVNGLIPKEALLVIEKYNLYR